MNNVSMFRLLNKYKIGKQTYYLLEDSFVLVIAKKSEVFKVKDNTYSLFCNKAEKGTPIKDFNKMFIYEKEIMILKNY